MIHISFKAYKAKRSFTGLVCFPQPTFEPNATVYLLLQYHSHNGPEWFVDFYALSNAAMFRSAYNAHI